MSPKRRNKHEEGAIPEYRIGLSATLLAAMVLAGCNSDSVLNMNSGQTPGQGLASAQTDQTLPAPGTQPGTQSGTQPGTTTDNASSSLTQAPQAAVSTSESIQFAPVIGAPANVLPALSSRLEARARQAGIPIIKSASGASIMMKGYFSAIADDGKTTVIYVWDVLDPSGNRLHRIQGQQAAPGGNGDGWSSVTPATMEAVADSTINQLATWLSRKSG